MSWKDLGKISDLADCDLNDLKKKIILDVEELLDSQTEDKFEFLFSLQIIQQLFNKNEFFISQEEEYIFYLTQLDGEVRQQKLKALPPLYANKKAATLWRNKIIQIIHPDKSRHPFVNKASQQLELMYKEMTGE